MRKQPKSIEHYPIDMSCPREGEKNSYDSLFRILKLILQHMKLKNLPILLF